MRDYILIIGTQGDYLFNHSISYEEILERLEDLKNGNDDPTEWEHATSLDDITAYNDSYCYLYDQTISDELLEI